MLATLVTFGVFALCLLIGVATFSLIDLRGNWLRNLLLSPVCGLAILLLPTLWLNQAGLPIRAFAVPLLIVLILVSAAVLAIRWPSIGWRMFLIFGVVTIAAFFLTDRPLLEFGFNFFSYSNSDAAFYTQASERIVHAGYFEPPPHSSLREILSSLDPSGWNSFTIRGERPGSELVLAFVASLTGRTSTQVYMVVMALAHLILVWAAAALVARSVRRLPLAIGVAMAVAFSSLTSLGVLYQLIAQVFGLSMLCFAVVAFQDRRLIRGLPDGGLRESTRRATGPIALAALSLMALAMTYPELLPFLVGAVAVFIALAIVRREVTFRYAAICLAAAACAAIVVLNFTFLSMLGILTQRIVYSNVTRLFILFPYYLMPSGFANFWGLVPVARFPRDPWMSVSIAIGMILAVFAVAAIVIAAWRRTVVGSVALVMSVLAVVLFFQQSDFGLYKLAMYAQPFVFASIAETLRILPVFRPEARGRFALFGLRGAAVTTAALAAIGMWSQAFYVTVSRDEPTSPPFGFIEIPHVSWDHIFDQLIVLSKKQPTGLVVGDGANVSLLQIEGQYERGHPTFLMTIEGAYILYTTSPNPMPVFPIGAAERSRIAQGINAITEPYFPLEQFDYDPSGSANLATFRGNRLSTSGIWNMSSTARQTIFNRSTIFDRTHDIVLVPAVDQPNHLKFLNTSLGVFVGGAGFDRSKTSVFQLEPDYFYPGQTMAALGRYFLFEVTQPSPKIRVILNLTSSLSHDSENSLSPAKVIGNRAIPFERTGRGSARLVSPPIAPRLMDGRSYVGIDLGRNGKLFDYPRTGLMQLYGTSLPYDNRKIVAFGRDISAISDDEYRRWSPPAALSRFPEDIANPQLEYSGLYEDGWLSDSLYVVLKGDRSKKHVVVDGFIPQIGTGVFRNDVSVWLDGGLIRRQALEVGNFTLRDAVNLKPGKHRLQLKFRRTEQLPEPDDRPIAAKVTRLGFYK